MNDVEIYQIYHPARCGSTLLTALISNCAKTYSEPNWTDLLYSYFIPEKLIEYNNSVRSIVKMQSIVTRIGLKPIGPKVFLYRPLAQYLQKMSEVAPNWIEKRKFMYGTHFVKIQGTELIIEPETIMQLHTIFWASCVLEMKKYDDVLWIRSNDFFLNKENTAKQVLTHFGLAGEPDMRFASINVKALNLNGNLSGAGEIQPFEYYDTELVEQVTDDRGIIETSTCLETQQIVETIEWAKQNIPLNYDFYY